jgi:hypothetical protein
MNDAKEQIQKWLEFNLVSQLCLVSSVCPPLEVINSKISYKWFSTVSNLLNQFKACSLSHANLLKVNFIAPFEASHQCLENFQYCCYIFADKCTLLLGYHVLNINKPELGMDKANLSSHNLQ